MKNSKKRFTLLLALALLLFAVPMTAFAEGEEQILLDLNDQILGEYKGSAYQLNETFIISRDTQSEAHSQYFTYMGTIPENREIIVTLKSEAVIAAGESNKVPITATVAVVDKTTQEPVNDVIVATDDAFAMVVPRPITVKPKDISVTYDGTEHKPTALEIVSGNLVDAAHRLVADADAFSGATDAGEWESRLTADGVQVHLYNEDGTFRKDISYNYAITRAKGTITVAKRPVAVTIDAAEKVYDGQPLPLTYNAEEVRSALAQGHAMQIHAEKDLINAGIKTPVVRIIGDKNNSVTDNYAIDLQSGTLEIKKAAIGLTSESKSKRYDGTALTAPAVTIEGTDAAKAVFAKEASVTATGTQTEVGETTNTIKITANAGDLYDPDNYAITKTEGKLTVTADDRTVLTITPKNKTAAYDGNAHGVSENPVAGTDYELDGILPSHHRLVVTLAAEAITDVGTKTITVAEAKILDTDSSDADITEQYVINTETGTLTVTKAQVTLTSPDAEKIYDGTALTAPTVTVSGTGAAIFNKEATAAATGSETHVYRTESGEFSPSYVTENNPIEITAKAGSNYKASNYDITMVEGSLLIRPVEITVTSKPIEKKYDGTPLTNNGTAPEVTWGSFLFGDSIACTFTESITDAGANENGNDFGYEFLPGTDSPSKEDDYEITKVVGTMQVHRRELKLTSGSAKKTYDGKKLVCQEVTITGDGMASGEDIYFSDFSSKTSVGKRDNKFSYSFSDNVKLNSDGDPINYNVTVKYGELKVSASGSSTQTGRDDHWPMLLGISALFVAAGIGIAIALKKKNSRNDG